MLMLAALAALAAAQSAYAEHHCKAPMSQMDMNACASLDFEAADAKLNAVWRKTLADARASDREIDRATDHRPTSEAELREAQRAWVQFRDAQCTFEGYSERGGSMEPMVREGCRARLTRQRTSQLQHPASENH